MRNSIRRSGLLSVKLALVTMLASCSSGNDTRSTGSVDIDATGEWSLVTTSFNQFDTTGAACLSGVGTLSVSNQRFTGSFIGIGVLNAATGTIEGDGTVVGQFTREGQTIGNVLGSFSNLSGLGTWADIFGCSGDWTATQ